MATVWIPALLSRFTQGNDRIDVPGATIAEVVDQLDARYPGIREKLVENGVLRPGLAVVVDSQVSRRGLEEVVGEACEVHFIAAIAGG